MKRTFILCITILFACCLSAAGLQNVKVYINPGHGSWGANDRPNATISYPNLKSTGMPDTCGFYESNTNLWKALELGKKLTEAGSKVTYSRTQSGPWPYEKVNGEYPGYSYDAYKALPDYEKYNRSLSEISEEVEAGNYDYFISIHSNATGTDGTLTNYPVLLYRGTDDGSDQNEDSRERCKILWPYLYACMNSGLDPSNSYSMTNMDIRGDLDFYHSGSYSTRSSTGKTYHGYLGVLKHGCPGYLSEGYFHTYEPARHRALNRDYCRQEGIRYFRGINAYYEGEGEKTGYIMGTVKDMFNPLDHPLYVYKGNSNDQYAPLNGAVVTLYKAGKQIATYTTDGNYNGLFIFENLEPGDDYTLDATCEGYHTLLEKYKAPISVVANETSYPMIFLKKNAVQEINVDAVWSLSKAEDNLPDVLKNMKKTATQGGYFVKDKAVFVQDATNGVLYKFDAFTGEYLATINSIKGPLAIDTDNAGNVIFFNWMNTDNGVQPLLYNLYTQTTTELCGVQSSSGVAKYPSACGDIMGGTGYVYAMANDANYLTRLHFENGQFIARDTFNTKDFSVGNNFVSPVDDHTVIILQRQERLFIFDLNTLTSKLIADNNNATSNHGGAYFEYGAGRFFAQGDKGAATSKGAFKIYDLTEERISETYYQENDLGTGSNFGSSAVMFETMVYDNAVYLYEYVPGIGLACYKVSYPGVVMTGIEDVETEVSQGSDNRPRKVMIDGHIYIISNDEMFDLQGRRVR